MDKTWLAPVLLWVAAARVAVGLAAIPLAPFLYEDHFLVLVLMRPTKEVFLAAGFLARRGDVGLVEVMLAAIPLSILGVWLFFYLGRAYSREVARCEVPGIGNRVLRPEKVQDLQSVLRAKGPRLIFLGRLAAFASSLVAVAAGSGRIERARFLRADAAGATVSLGVTLGAGYLLGEAYEEAGPWLTAAGIVALVLATVVAGRQLKRT